MKIKIVSGCCKEQQCFGNLNKLLLEQYAAKHGYDFEFYINESFYFIPGLEITSLEQQTEKQWEQRRVHNWNKVSIVATNLYDYDVVVWIDADAYIVNTDLKIEDVFELNSRHKFYVSYDAEFINMGIFAVKNDPIIHQLFRQWIKLGVISNDYYIKGYLSEKKINCFEQGAWIQMFNRNDFNLIEITNILPPCIVNSHYQKEFWRGPHNDHLQYNDKSSFILHLAGINYGKRIEVATKLLNNERP